MYKKFFLGVLAVTISVPAYAHAGDHGEGSFLQMVYHFLSEPLHAGVTLAAVICFSFWLRASRDQQVRKLASRRC